ncbi:ABC transporter substrate-binding protein [Desulfosporosinus hippei]|uniref:Branched-chain amino acid transport system substrate-binding protein n=1 Tax=Desulfosporosinus hippei DSM 8344 TaxID=1121419 RepID=A0A1G7W6J4_9FIRM|nr:ABC transporter substrate-binding protein [Desulfosporosinus hippei]SDG67419.1 branched-chain amino acid transport system substrate-binding protein [Desulfosporosinus hippei DSM 8344]
MKNMSKGLKRRLGLALLLVISLLISACSPTKEADVKSTTASANEPYKIGAVLDISGNSSSLGVPERDTLLMMVEKLNSEGGINGHPVDLTIMDNKSDETESVLAAKTLIEKGSLAILGASSSGTSMAMIKTVESEKVPMISLAAASSIVEPTSDRKWVFKTAQSDIVMISKIISYLKKNDLNKIAFLYMNNSYGDNGKKAITAAVKDSGISIVAEEKFDANDKDMTPQLSKVKASEAQVVIVWAIPPSASILTKNFKDVGLTIPLIHSHGVGNQKFIELAQGAADGTLLPIGKLSVAQQITDADPQKKVLESYIADYVKKYNSEPNSFGGYAWDAFNLLVSALEKAGPDREAIRGELEKTQGFVGISGVFNMSPEDHNGLKEDSAVLVKVDQGKWKLIE